jgi:hypothetical protein
MHGNELVSRPPWTAAALLAAFLACGCTVYRNPHGPQDTPPVIRLTTVPEETLVELTTPGLGYQQLTGSCDLPAGVAKTTVITVSKDGYHPWTGPISALPQTGRWTYKVELKPLVPEK